MLPVRKSESPAGLILGIGLLHCRSHGPPLNIIVAESLFSRKRAQGLYLNIFVPLAFLFLSFDSRDFGPYLQAPVVKMLGSAIHRIHNYPVGKYNGNQ